MVKIVVLLLMWTIPQPLCDWHFGHHGGGSIDPESQAMVDASLAAMGAIVLGTVFMTTVGGPLVLVWTRRVRHLFWSVPLVNAVFYLAMALIRPFPGGWEALWRGPGVGYTIVVLICWLLCSFGSALLLALIYLLYRTIKKVFTAVKEAPQPEIPN
jgi:hypothetical protein